jgi:toluene monooxygenase system protein B
MIPFISNFYGDFVLLLVAVPVDSTMDEVAAAAAHHSVGKRVAPQPGKVIRVRKQGDTEFIERNKKICDTGIQPMECLEFMFTEPA